MFNVKQKIYSLKGGVLRDKSYKQRNHAIQQYSTYGSRYPGHPLHQSFLIKYPKHNNRQKEQNKENNIKGTSKI
mgnify:CR=1 FL=1